MTRRQIGSIFGLAAIVAAPHMGLLWYSIRGLSGIFLIGAIVMQVVARVPVKAMIVLLRAFCIALGVLLGQSSFANRHYGIHPVGMIFAATFFVVGVAPSLPFHFRVFFYRASLWLGWAALAFIGFFGRSDESSIVMLPGALLAMLYFVLRKWRETPTLVPDIIAKQRSDAQNTLLALDQTPTVILSAYKKMAMFRLRYSLWRLKSKVEPASERAMSIAAACQDIPQIALSWQVAYLAKIVARDYAGAAEVVYSAQRQGFDDPIFERALGYALFHQNDPTWRDVLQSGWNRALRDGLPCSQGSYFSMNEDPTYLWCQSDPTFALLRQQLQLTALPPPVQPVLLRL